MSDDKIKKQAQEINMLYKVNEEQETEINRLKMIITIKHDACINLVEENKKLQSELTDSKNDLKQAINEIKLLNNQIDKLNSENKNLRRNIEYLCDENVRIRHELYEVINNDNNY